MSTKSKAGRKPIEDKKVQLCVYLPQSVINSLGGKAEAQNKAATYLSGLTN